MVWLGRQRFRLLLRFLAHGLGDTLEVHWADGLYRAVNGIMDIGLAFAGLVGLINQHLRIASSLVDGQHIAAARRLNNIARIGEALLGNDAAFLCVVIVPHFGRGFIGNRFWGWPHFDLPSILAAVCRTIAAVKFLGRAQRAFEPTGARYHAGGNQLASSLGLGRRSPGSNKLAFYIGGNGGALVSDRFGRCCAGRGLNLTCGWG
ncbi:MAG: hypothetical protein B7Z71_03875 [Acidocella sp. 21-58-7]|nr:MAG: hypothetical protein B7Z71_03875 [Acidocella sp. 21-58-7]